MTPRPGDTPPPSSTAVSHRRPPLPDGLLLAGRHCRALGPGNQEGLWFWVQTQAEHMRGGTRNPSHKVVPRAEGLVLLSVIPFVPLPGPPASLTWRTGLPQADNPSFPNPRRRLRLQDLADRVVDASEDEHELNQLLNEALLERESAQM